MIVGSRISCVSITVLIAAGAGPAARAADKPPAYGTVLRFAASIDGQTFTPTGDVFQARAAAPALAVRERGEILAIFDWVESSEGPAAALAVRRSPDDGRTWSPPRKVRLDAGEVGLGQLRSAAVATQPGGAVRLYFTVPSTRAGESRPDRALRSAVSRNGIDFRLDDAARFRLPDSDLIRAAATGTGAGVLLIASAGGRQNGEGSAESCVETSVAVARDGRRFAFRRPATLEGIEAVTAIVQTGRGFRAYGSAGRTVRSLVSRDGLVWQLESGVRMENGWDPAVVRLADGSYLMLYCTAAGLGNSDAASAKLHSAQSPSAEAPSEADSYPDGPELVPFELLSEDEFELVAAQDATEPDGPSTDAEDIAVDLAGGESLDQTPDLGDVFADLPTDWPEEETDEWAASNSTHLSPLTPHSSAGFAPRPNFDEPIDYFEWYREHALDKPEDNAYEAYAEFMPGPGEEPDWAPFKNMYSDPENQSPPAPWYPADRPDWEESYQASRQLLDRFRQATRHSGYAHPAQIAEGSIEGTDGVPLLLNMVLPHLPSHRLLAKAVLSDAWRLEAGQVPPQRMLDAWETTLRAADHLGRGATLIENLVSVAERGLVQENARWALARGVFSDAELRSALDVLNEHDQDRTDPARGLRGEQAFAMDITQFIFEPTDSADRERRLTKMADGGGHGRRFRGQ